MNIKILGDNVKRLRHSRGWTVRGLASKADLSPATISQIENVKYAKVSKETLNALADVFEVTVNDLFAVEEGRYEVNDFFEAVCFILNSDELTINGKLLNAAEKNKIIETCKDLEYSIIARRENQER